MYFTLSSASKLNKKTFIICQSSFKSGLEHNNTRKEQLVAGRIVSGLAHVAQSKVSIDKKYTRMQ